MTRTGTDQPPPLPHVGLHNLGEVVLSDEHQDLLARAHAPSVGPAPWRQRKLQAVRDVLALCQIAPRDRLEVLALDMTERVQIALRMNVPVPCMAPAETHLVVREEAELWVRYPQEVMITDLPGFAFVQIHRPAHVWHANVHPVHGALCLGERLPRNFPLKELVWLSFTAIALQQWMFDVQDKAGVLNRRAAHWWSLNRARFPLTRTGLLEDQPL